MDFFTCVVRASLLVVASAVNALAVENFVESPTGERMVIKVEQLDKWKDGRENIQFVLNSTAKTLWRHFPDRRVGELLVRPKGGPITLARRGPKGERYVWLDTGDAYWCQYTFQFAHEVGHVLTDNVHYDHRNMWFEESLCEVCSLFALKQMADDWDKHANGRWKRFVPSIRQYVKDRMDQGKLPKGVNFQKWFEDELPNFYGNHELRTKNLIVAKELLTLFESEPKHLAAISYLNRGDILKHKQFDQFLANWHAHVPKAHKGFVASVASKFGIELPRTKPD
ncbi:MAG: hypothetical protein MI757_15695 [Pirellulales bacterium]|nr:hypothetical protein [Pirellulales bacterium]